MSAAVNLYELLGAADREGFAVPHGTSSIRTDTRLILHIADETDLGAGDLYRAFFGRPVRQTRAIIQWVQLEAPGDLEEQTEMILRWSQREVWREGRRQSRRSQQMRGVA